MSRRVLRPAGRSTAPRPVTACHEFVGSGPLSLAKTKKRWARSRGSALKAFDTNSGQEAMINILDDFARLNDNVPPRYRGLDRLEHGCGGGAGLHAQPTVARHLVCWET